MSVDEIFKNLTTESDPSDLYTLTWKLMDHFGIGVAVGFDTFSEQERREAMGLPPVGDITMRQAIAEVVNMDWSNESQVGVDLIDEALERIIAARKAEGL